MNLTLHLIKLRFVHLCQEVVCTEIQHFLIHGMNFYEDHGLDQHYRFTSHLALSTAMLLALHVLSSPSAGDLNASTSLGRWCGELTRGLRFLVSFLLGSDGKRLQKLFFSSFWFLFLVLNRSSHSSSRPRVSSFSAFLILRLLSKALTFS